MGGPPGRVALVTGGAGGIGRAVAARLLAEGACVLLADIHTEALAQAEASFVRAFGRDQIQSVGLDVTDEEAVAQGFAVAAWHNVTDPIESLIRSADEIRHAYAQALLVDRAALAGYQEANDALMASETLRAAFRTDVARARLDAGGAIDPIVAYRESGYRAKVAVARPAARGGGGGIVCPRRSGAEPERPAPKRRPFRRRAL